MGTRNLTCVVKDGEYKLAKYGQWDGHRESLGAEILTFLRDEFDREKFLKGLSKVKLITTEKLQQFWTEVGADPKSNFCSMEVSEKFKQAHPELSRDPSGAVVLRMIQAGTCEWSRPGIEFAADSLFCEWAYVIDLDKNTFEIYEGFNKTPLDSSERFANVPLPPLQAGENREYYQVRLLRSYSLRRLPTVKVMCRARKVNKQPVAA